MHRLPARRLLSSRRCPSKPLLSRDTPAIPIACQSEIHLPAPSAAGIARRRSDVLLPSTFIHFRTPDLSARGVEAALLRRFSSINEKDDILLEEEAEKKAGWLLKIIFIGSASFLAFQFFPYMGDNLLQQSISLLRIKDPLYKRMGASRLFRYAVDDERRMKVVEMGGAQELLNMLQSARDDKTRKSALKALVALSHSDAAAEFLHQASATTIVNSIPDSVEYAEIAKFKASILEKFQNLRHNIPPSEETSADNFT